MNKQSHETQGMRIDPVLWRKMWWLALQNMLPRGRTAINCSHPRSPDHDTTVMCLSQLYIFSRQLHVVFLISVKSCELNRLCFSPLWEKIAKLIFQGLRPHLSLICLFLLTTAPLSFLFTFFCLSLFYFISKECRDVKCKAVEEETRCFVLSHVTWYTKKTNVKISKLSVPIFHCGKTDSLVSSSCST